MNDVVVKTLIRLFAIVSNLSKNRASESTLEVLRKYLLSFLNADDFEEYWQEFNNWLRHYSRNLDTEQEDETQKINQAFMERVDDLCHQINTQLNLTQKFYILIQLLEYMKGDQNRPIEKVEEEFVTEVAHALQLNMQDYQNLADLILRGADTVKEPQNLLYISGQETQYFQKVKHIQRDNLGSAKLEFLYLTSVELFVFQYTGEHNLHLNSALIHQKKVQFFTIGSYIGSSRIKPIYYRNVADKFMTHLRTSKEFVFVAKNASYKFEDGRLGVTNFNISEKSGNLIGIVGGSGVGKSTLLNMLNGSLKPQEGCVRINGVDIYSKENDTQGLIGFVPQDDLLFETLTVAENLYYNARLSFDNLSHQQIQKLVDETINSFRLTDARDLIVGDPVNKVLSGGQRKRLNIALEVMRNPLVLFVDEPTSGLSSVDSEYIISVLKRQTLLGRMVFANIHQPSSDIFKQFDKLIVLDKGGTIIYYGNPVDALVYFRSITKHVNAQERECPKCQNVRVEQILRIVEAYTIDETGRRTRERKVNPQQWHQEFQEKILPTYNDFKEVARQDLKSDSQKPNKIRQLLIFVRRDVRSKIRNKQFVSFTLLLTPILAFVLSFFTKKTTNSSHDFGHYLFSDNNYISGYIFMSVIVAFFVGLMASAEDIIKDKKILQREKFLHLSWKSYVNAKIVNLFIVSLFQSFIFVLIGNFVLGIPNLFIECWMMFFACLCLANIIGLNLSASIKSAVSIYILIPAIVVPQLLFGGMLIDYNKHYTNIKKTQVVPIPADLFSSKAAYEAIMVSSFKYNQFNKHFYAVNKQISETEFVNYYVVPALKIKVNEAVPTEQEIDFIKRELHHICITSACEFDKDITLANFKSLLPEINAHIDQAKYKLMDQYNELIQKKDAIYHNLVDKYGEGKVDRLKQKHHNKYIESTVTNSNELVKIVESETNYVQISNPIYRDPQHPLGRSQLFAPSKNFLGIKMSTYIFNFLTIVLKILFWIFMLYFNILSTLINKANYVIDRLFLR